MNLTEAIRAYKLRNPKVTTAEISAFIHGWTACEVATDVTKLLTIKAN